MGYTKEDFVEFQNSTAIKARLNKIEKEHAEMYKALKELVRLMGLGCVDEARAMYVQIESILKEIESDGFKRKD